MSATSKSTLTLSLDMKSSLVIFRLLDLRLHQEENYGHNVEAYMVNGSMTLNQVGDATGRVVTIRHNSINGSHSIVFGTADSFANCPEGEFEEVSLRTAIEMCAEVIDPPGVFCHSFHQGEHDMLVNFLYRWMFATVL